MFRVFAQAHERKVPVVRNASVRVLVDRVVGGSNAADVRISGIGYIE